MLGNQKAKNKVGVLKHTDASPQIQGTEDPDGQIRVNLADDLDSVARSKVGFLCGIDQVSPELSHGAGRGAVRRAVPSPSRLFLKAPTRFRWALMLPSASMTACSPRSWLTLPIMVTFRPTKLSRYGAVARGVAW